MGLKKFVPSVQSSLEKGYTRTMKNPGKYESTLEATILSLDLVTQMDKANFLELREAAYKIDQLRTDLADCSRRMAARLASFADDIADGRTHMSPPTGSSLLDDITEKTAVLNEKTSAFPTLLRLVLGPTAPKEFFRLLKEGR
jgi:hypothetical protein